MSSFFKCFTEQVDNDGGNVEAVQWTTRRTLAETVPNSTLILAEKRTRRKDPLDGFNHYNGGWNISDKHYWSVSLKFILNQTNNYQFFFFPGKGVNCSSAIFLFRKTALRRSTHPGTKTTF